MKERAEALRTRHEAEELAARLPPLLVEAERVAATVVPGTHGRRRVGPGDSFWQFRRYQPGDPVAMIDWRQSAKADPVFIREKEWTAAQSVWLWMDSSPSMAYRSSRSLPEKGERATVLLLALALLLVGGGEKVALLGGGERPMMGRAAIARLTESLLRGGAGEGGLPAPAPLPRHAQVVLLGDFLAPLEEIEAALKRLGSSARGHLVQIMDPAEESLPFSGRVVFAGLEGEGRHLVSRTEDVRQEYVERLAAHRDGLAAICRGLGWSFTLHHTDTPAQAALLSLHATLSGQFHT